LKFCKELIKETRPDYYHLTFLIIKLSKITSYGLLLLFIIQHNDYKQKVQIRSQLDPLWKFPSYVMSLSLRGQRIRKKMEKLHEPIDSFFSLLSNPGNLSLDHSQLVVEKILSYFSLDSSLVNQTRTEGYLFAKAAILLKVFTQVSLRQLVSVKFMGWNSQPLFKILVNGRWSPFRIPIYNILEKVNPLTAMYDLLDLKRQLNLNSEYVLVRFNRNNEYLELKYLREYMEIELRKVDLKISDLCNLRDTSGFLSEMGSLQPEVTHKVG
jgi:hypothetical protein